MSRTIYDVRSRAARQRDSYSGELTAALAIAGFELEKLKQGLISFSDCPGLATIAHEIHKANTHIKPADTRE